jgi:hypothetical protein
MPTARLRLSNVCEVGLSTNSIPQLSQSATALIVCHALHTIHPIQHCFVLSITWIALPFPSDS